MAFANPGSIVKALGIESGQTVVDVGSGSGAYVPALAQCVGASGTIYAVEIQKELVAKIGAESKAAGLKMVKPLWADAEALGGVTLPDGVADWVLISNLFSQSSHGYILAKEINRILKPGGKVAVIDWLKSAATVKQILSSSGLELIEEIADTGSHHFGLILTKKIWKTGFKPFY